MAYSWRNDELFDLLRKENYIKVIGSEHRTEINIVCPVCGGRKCHFNMQKGIWHCFSGSCNKGGDTATLASICWDVSLSEARDTIEQKLGIKDSNGKVVERPQREVVKRPEPVEEKLASPEVLDQTYRAFLNELPLSEKHKYHLLSRGFTLNQIERLSYRSFPHLVGDNYFKICEHLITAGYTLKGVPGFFSYYGKWTFLAGTPGIIMPRVNRNNQITGLQIRKDDDLRRNVIKEDGSTKLEEKCWWFTSKGQMNGTGAFTAIHYSTDFIMNRTTREYIPVINTIGGKRGIYFTEGIMKADLCSQIFPKIPFLCNQGVNCLNDLEKELKYLKESHDLTTVVLAYDQDYHRNVNVEVPLKKAGEIINSLGLELITFEWDEDIVVNGETIQLKGIDDYLAYHKLGIVPKVKTPVETKEQVC